jgi:hypothetical protein
MADRRKKRKNKKEGAKSEDCRVLRALKNIRKMQLKTGKVS